MKLERIKIGRQPKAGDVLRTTPEAEQPLEIDLRGVITTIKELNPKIYPSNNSQFLLSALGPSWLEQLMPTWKKDIKKMLGGLRGPAWSDPERAFILARAKQLRPEEVVTEWNPATLKESLDGVLKRELKKPVPDWMYIVWFAILLPEERDTITNAITPLTQPHLDHTRGKLAQPSIASLARPQLVAMRLLGLEERAVEGITRQEWSKWKELLDRLLARCQAKIDLVEDQNSMLDDALDLALCMNFLGAEKVGINDKGLVEITVAKKKPTQSPNLPERPGF